MLCCGLKILRECAKRRRNKATDLIVKNGKPVLVISYTTLLRLIFGTIALTCLIVLYCISIFVAALHTKLDIGAYINMISEHKDGDVLPMLFAIPAMICLILSFGAAYLVFKCLRSPKTKSFTLNKCLFIYVFVCLGGILSILVFCNIILTHIYGDHSKLHNGIADAMSKYSLNSKIKSDVDNMQVEFQCCGSKSYDEWYKIQWYDPNLMKKGYVIVAGI